MRIWIYVETARTVFTNVVSNAFDHCKQNDEDEDEDNDGSDGGGRADMRREVVEEDTVGNEQIPL